MSAYPDFDDLDDEREYEDEFDCHMGPGGYCGAAGSEDCEFECPYRAAQRAGQYRRRSARQATQRAKRDDGQGLLL